MAQASSIPAAERMQTPSTAPLVGSVRVLIQFDVCEEIRLDQLQQSINSRTIH
jgi:hypothetical protein